MDKFDNSGYVALENALKNHGKDFSDLYANRVVSRQLITELKSGRTRTLSQSKAERIANFLDCSVAEIYGENKKPAPIIESGELNRKKIFAEMLSCLPERDRIVIEHNILMLWRLAREEGTLKPSETTVDLDWIIGNLSARRDHLLGANA